MARYVALIDGKPGAYGVNFPDCLGCTAMGATIDDALESATEALREWMAERVAGGLAISVPRTVEAIKSDPTMAEELAGAVFATVPLLLDASRSVRANLSLDAGLLAQIDEAARARGITRSAFMASAAREKIFAQR